MLLDGVLEFPVGLLKFRNFHGQLSIGTIVLTRHIVAAWSVLHAFPYKGLFWSTVLLIRRILCSTMGHVHVPMLLA